MRLGIMDRGIKKFTINKDRTGSNLTPEILIGKFEQTKDGISKFIHKEL